MGKMLVFEFLAILGVGVGVTILILGLGFFSGKITRIIDNWKDKK